MEMEYGKALSFPRQDPDWLKKIGIAGLLSLVPVFGWVLVAGYETEVMRRVINDQPRPLPEWSDFGGLLIKGFSAIVVRIGYLLPLILLAACSGAPYLVGNAIVGANRTNPNLMNVVSWISACFGSLAVLYAIVSAMLAQISVARYAATGNLAAAFHLGEVWRLFRTKPGVYLATTILSALVYVLWSVLGVIACVIGAAFGWAYATVIAGHLQGQAYRYVTRLSSAHP
jgi:hypothetical protein